MSQQAEASRIGWQKHPDGHQRTAAARQAVALNGAKRRVQKMIAGSPAPHGARLTPDELRQLAALLLSGAAERETTEQSVQSLDMRTRSGIDPSTLAR